MKEQWEFGRHADGRPISAYRLTSNAGYQAVILNRGAILQNLRLPDGANACLGFETWDGYEKDKGYIGRIIGPNANRIVGAKYALNETEVQLTANEGDNNLHSGPNGFDVQLWDVIPSDSGLQLVLKSPHGAHGFPSKILATLNISLRQNTLKLQMRVTSSQPIPANMTWHPYWNLSGQGRIDGHNLRVDSVERTQLEAPSPFPVKDTLYDFRKALPLGSIQLDTNYRNAKCVQLRFGKTVMTVKSSLPDMQIYTGDALARPRAGIAIEPQFRPNDINLAQDSLLREGEIYDHWIEYSFDTL